MQYKAVTMTALLGLVSAQTKMHVVSVSGDGNTFKPDNIKATVGEMIQFQFRAGNHSVVQSNFDNPCTPIGSNGNVTGFYSGFQDVAASEAMDMIPTYTIQVTDTKPIWVYCSKATHCQGGMSMVINENPTLNASRTLTAYRDLAKAATANVSPDGSSNAGGSSGSGTSGGDSGTTTGGDSATSSDTTTTPGTGAGSIVAVSRAMGLVAVAAAVFML